MTDNVFDLNAFLAQAANTSNELYGEFQKAVVNPGFYSFATGVEYDKRFVPVEIGKPNAMDIAREQVLKLGDKFAIGFSLRLIAGTRINEDQDHKQQEDYVYVFKKSSEKVDGVYVEKFDWTTFFNSVQENVPPELYGQEIWVHVAGKRHPRFNAEDSITWDYDTVKFKNKEMVMDNEGKPKPLYHKYIAAAFRTKEELVEYMAANGADLGDVKPEKNYPVPANWQLGDESWPECANSIVADIAASKPLPLIFNEWKDTGVTLEDIKNMQGIFAGEVPF